MVLLVEVVALATHDIEERRHDHAGRAVAALQTVVLAERLLHRVQRPVGSARPSMVVILAPSHCTASKVQDFAAMPSTCTTRRRIARYRNPHACQ